jgi:uncharacterized membrane protein (DUF2068 family)
MRSRQPLLAGIVAFKAVKALALAALGATLLATRQSDPVDLVVRLALAIHLPLTSRLFARALAFVANLTVSRQTALAATAFGYSALMGAEGIALYRRRPWARWFTIGATGSLVPIEIYEIAREVHPARVIVLVVNVLVVIYLWRRRDIFEQI